MQNDVKEGKNNLKSFEFDATKYITDSNTKQISIYLPKSLIEDLAEYMKSKGLKNRNQFVLSAVIEKMKREV